MKFVSVKIKKPAEINFILAQSHFIKTVEDVHETLVEAVPGIKFGIAFCEASGPRKIRTSGTDDEIIKLSIDNAKRVACGHSLFIFLKNAFPVNVLNRIKNISEIVTIFCATANSVEVIVAQTKQGRAILGVVDGGTPLGVEKKNEVDGRKELLRRFGYKL
ncbi:adenosine-specific kinase [Candidatus Roizmanbacteria bacterium]|nr:adenosine-specific kinase [Candidatus Roizmanbacteria bacterium]